MDTGGPACGPGRDEDPDPDLDWPGRVTPDWMDEAEWKRYCAAGDDDGRCTSTRTTVSRPTRRR